MPDTYIVNPLSKESEPSKEEPDAARDMSMCCLTYFFCCLPIIMGSTG